MPSASWGINEARMLKKNLALIVSHTQFRVLQLLNLGRGVRVYKGHSGLEEELNWSDGLSKGLKNTADHALKNYIA